MNKSDGFRTAALEYHERDRRGKIEVVPTKSCLTQRDLSLAYTPGVAQPCLEIQEDSAAAQRYTARGNLVAVVTNGTAVLGLGNIGALAGKPVMEGKSVLFKRFADIDVFDIELDTEDPDAFISIVKAMEPTFGGINLEDIKAPECFYIEERLKAEMNIPVFHDDQHGTAIISGAALLNALEIVGKDIGDVRVVFNGAGAAGIACARFYIALGVSPENILMLDSKGVLWEGRGGEEKNEYKKPFFQKTEARTLADAMQGADVFCGVSVKDALTQEMVRSMAERPIVFAMANPDPEISYADARKARPDCIVATGRSDFPNQVNNVLGFPFIFRGALDVDAVAINDEMKLAAAHALADLAREDVPESVKRVYDEPDLHFGPEYIIPKPFDPRVLIWATMAVAEAAIASGVARKSLDLDEYREHLLEKIDRSREIMRNIFVMARKAPKRIVFPEGYHPKIIWAATEIVNEGLAHPILIGKKSEILAAFEELHHSPDHIEIVEPKRWPHRQAYIDAYYELRQRKGITQSRAELDLRNYFHFGMMMVHNGHADGMVAGVTAHFPEVLRPALQIFGPREEGRTVAGMYLLMHEHKLYFLADCAVNVNPSVDRLAEIALMASKELERWQIEPRIAMLSFSNFGSVRRPETDRVGRAVQKIREIKPDLHVDGPVQADVALDPELVTDHFPFADLKRRPNLLIFPELNAGNISLRLLQKLSNAHIIGPIMIGLDKPIHLATRTSSVTTLVNLAAIASVDAR